MNSKSLKRKMACLGIALIMLVSLTPHLAIASGQSDFVGVWQGRLSNLPFEITVWELHGQWNATISFEGQPENLEILGWKESVEMFYFFRRADVACISMFVERGVMNLAYFERDSVKRVTLRKKR